MRAWRRSPAGWLFSFTLIISAASPGAISQTVSVPPPQSAPAAPSVFDLALTENDPGYCEYLSRGKEHPAALVAVCKFALSLRWKLPNVICDQERKLYQEGQLGEAVRRQTITAKVRYEDGQEQYTDITINGKPSPSAKQDSVGTWSEGEFATGLRAVFLPQSATEFKFVKQEALRSARALVFDLRVHRINNRFWYLESSGRKTFPGYHGRLWINQSSLHLMRFERKLEEVEADFPIQQASTVIDYSDVDLADGTNFVLPLRGVDVTCATVDSLGCWHNQLTFNHWHKFAAHARVVITQEEPGATPTPAPPSAPVQNTIPPPDIASLPPVDLSRGSPIAAEILNYQFAEIERAQEQSEAAAAALLAASKTPTKTESAANLAVPAVQTANQSTDLPADQVPVLRTSVKLVLVPTVVRDSQGRTVDHLQKLDFRLLDDRNPQLITQFSMERPGSLAAAERESAGVPSQIPTRHAAYVFDDIHSTLDELVRARDAAKRHLTSLPPEDRAAIFTLSGNITLNFTDDAAKLSEAIQRLRPHPLTATGSIRCPDISYTQADLIQNNNDAIALSVAIADALQCAYGGDSREAGPARRLVLSTAAQVLIAGRAETQASFTVLKEVVREISRMPGQRCVVLVSPGFPTAEMQQEAAQIIDDALHAQVIINVLDPSGLSIATPMEYGSASQPSDVLADLTSGTGGTFFRNRNDVEEGFQKTALPDLFYILGFSPQKLDGRFHKLKVTLQRPEKLSIQARRGYFAPKPAN